MPAPVLMSGAGALLVNLPGPISETICLSIRPLLYTGNRSGGALTTANWYSKYKSPGTKYNGDSSQAGSGDPGLVDLQKQDYHLKADSPLLGKAINLSEFYQSDFDGRPLPETGNWDIGAIQYSAAQPTIGKQPER